MPEIRPPFEERLSELDRRERRRQFAMRAPDAIPDWFQPVMPEYPAPPKRPVFEVGSTFPELFADVQTEADRQMVQAVEAAIAVIRAAGNGDIHPDSRLEVAEKRLRQLASYYCTLFPHCEMSDEQIETIRDFAVAWNTYEVNHNEWERVKVEWRNERERRRVAQWPWVWADLVLAAESGSCQQ